MTLNPLLRTLTLFLTLSTATFGFAETIPKPSPVKVSLHRGALKYAPENTLPAFEKAIELGADFVEFDIRPSSDGVYYLLHDGKLDRTTDGKGPINQLSSKEIDQLDAGSWFSPRFKGERVPTLEQFLERVAGRIGLYVDAKEIVAEDLIEALRKHKSLDSAVVYGDVDFLVRLKELEPSIKTLAPLSSLEEIDPILKRLKTDAFDCSWDALSKELIDRCHQKGVMVFSDAMGQHENLEDYLQAIEWGIDLIQTDHPDRVREAIREYQRRKEIPKLIEGGAVRQTDPPSREIRLEAGVIEVGGRTISFPAQSFTIPPEPVLEVAEQLYRVGNATEQKSPSHWDGESARGPGTQRTYQRLVPGSLVVSSTDGQKTFQADVDYIYDNYWGSIKPRVGGEIPPNSEVKVGYSCFRCRYDSLAIDSNGRVSIIRGESMPPDSTELLLPNAPDIPPLSLRMANIFTGWTNEVITEGTLGEFVPNPANRTNPQVRPAEVGGRYDDILPRDYLVEIAKGGPVGVATYRVAASGDPYGVDPPRTLEDPVFGPEIQSSTSKATPVPFPVAEGRVADFSLRIDFRPFGETDLVAGDRWTLHAEPRMIFSAFTGSTSPFPDEEVLEQRKRVARTLGKLEAGETVRVVFLGESTTAGGYWPTLFEKGLQHLYPRATVEAFNVGIGGETILGGLPRLETDVLSKNPDLVILEYIINDSWTNFSHVDSTGPGRIETAHRELLQKIKDRGGIEVAYLTANFGNPAFVSGYTFENFRRTSDLYRRLCEDYNCAFVDAFRVWENMGSIHGEYFLTRLKGNMVNHPFANFDKPWSGDRDNAEWLLKLFENKKD